MNTEEAPQRNGAQFSRCRRYRYALWRTWHNHRELWPDQNPRPNYLAVCGLNPSTADEKQNDPTVRLCINLARRWGFDGLIMLNIFAFRSTNPRGLWTVEDPGGGRNNDQALAAFAARSVCIVAAWGAHGRLYGRSDQVCRLFEPWPVYCLGRTKGQEPRHPLYLKRETIPAPFNDAAKRAGDFHNLAPRIPPANG